MANSVATFPHAEKAVEQVKSCPDCHKSVLREIVPEFKESVHVQAHLANFTCSSCHDPHVWMKASTVVLPRMLVRQDNMPCRSCHDDDLKFAQFTTKKRRDLTVIHNWQPNPELHWTAVRCIDCHTAEKAGGASSHQI